MGLCYGRPAPAPVLYPVQDEVDKDNNTSDVVGPTPKRPSTPKLPKFPFYLPSPLPASYKPIGRILNGADIGPHSVRCPSDALLSPLSLSMLEQEKDWTGLPPELIEIIVKKLPDLLDFIRFRATCKAWRSSAPLSDPPPQLPWFLELTKGEYDGTCTWQIQRFYSISSCQTLTTRFKSRGWFVKGAFSHYLPFRNLCGALSFINPLTKDEFSLSWPHAGFFCPWPTMVWTGTDPIRNRSIVAVGVDEWACHDPHNNKWVEQRGMFSNNCYWQGMFFSTDVTSVTKVIDASSKKLLHNIPPLMDELIKTDEFFYNNLFPSRESYLVESLGTILRVSWDYNMREEEIVEDSIFDIYRLEFDGLDGQPCWVRVHNIGNQILFLQEKAGFSMTARPSTGFREGCIYFINPFGQKPYVYDILAGTVERIPCPFERWTWFLPGLC